MTRRSGVLFLNSSARTPAHPQTHEPGERKKRDDGLSPEGETGTEGGKQNVALITDQWWKFVSCSTSFKHNFKMLF